MPLQYLRDVLQSLASFWADSAGHQSSGAVGAELPGQIQDVANSYSLRERQCPVARNGEELGVCALLILHAAPGQEDCTQNSNSSGTACHARDQAELGVLNFDSISRARRSVSASRMARTVAISG